MESTQEEVESWLNLIRGNPVIAFFIGLVIREIVNVFQILETWLRYKLLNNKRRKQND